MKLTRRSRSENVQGAVREVDSQVRYLNGRGRLTVATQEGAGEGGGANE